MAGLPLSFSEARLFFGCLKSQTKEASASLQFVAWIGCLVWCCSGVAIYPLQEPGRPSNPQTLAGETPLHKSGGSLLVGPNAEKSDKPKKRPKKRVVPKFAFGGFTKKQRTSRETRTTSAMKRGPGSQLRIIPNSQLICRRKITTEPIWGSSRVLHKKRYLLGDPSTKEHGT